MSDIQDRLKKLPPFDEDIPMMEEVKKISEQQSTPPVSRVAKKEAAEVMEKEAEEQVEPEATEEQVEEPQEEPKEVSERTAEQFEKLKESNKELKEENKVLYNDVLSSLRPPEPTEPIQDFTPQIQQKVDETVAVVGQDKVDDIFANLIDKDGYIDPDLLKNTLKQTADAAKRAQADAEAAKKEAQEARQETKRTKRDFEEDEQVREVHKKYPQIDPKNESFNEFFWDDVRKEIATAPILRGTTPTFMQAADAIWNARYADKEEVAEVNKKEKKVVEEAENAKKQINASATTSGRSSTYYDKSDIESLKADTMAGKRGALAERLRRAGQ